MNSGIALSFRIKSRMTLYGYRSHLLTLDNSSANLSSALSQRQLSLTCHCHDHHSRHLPILSSFTLGLLPQFTCQHSFPQKTAGNDGNLPTAFTLYGTFRILYRIVNLVNNCTATADVAGRQHLRSASQRKLIVPRYRLTISVVGVLLLRARRLGFRYPPDSLRDPALSL